MRAHLLLKAKPELMHQVFKMHDGTERSLADVPDDAEACGHHSGMIRATCALLRSIDRSNYPEENQPDLRSLFHKIRKCFLIINMGGTGFELYVPNSGFQHSCRPNASCLFKGKKLEVRAMRDIAEREDVTIDLADLMMPKAGRQKQLTERKGILCVCERCREGDQEDEVSELAANEDYRCSICSEQVFPSPRSVFDGFMRLMEIKEKYQGRYHPDFVYCMYMAAFAAPGMPNKTLKDKQNFDLLIERLKEAIPLSYGLDCEVVNMQSLLIIQQNDWSDVLP